MGEYTNDQLIQVIDTLIENNTDHLKEEFTGGSIGVTIVNNATLIKYKFTMYFGFKNKNAISKVIEVDKNIYNILVDALEVKTKSLLDTSSKLSLDDINTILTTGSKIDSTTSTKTNTIITNTIITNTNLTSESEVQEKEQEQYSERFLKIWDFYKVPVSKKGSKSKAYKSYIKNKLDDKENISLVLKAEMKKEVGKRHLVTIFNNFNESLEVASEILNEVETVSPSQEKENHKFEFKKAKVISDKIKDYLDFEKGIDWLNDYYWKDKPLEGIGWQKVLHPHLGKEEILLYKIESDYGNIMIQHKTDDVLDIEVIESN